jgi:predicted transposase YbfD/YdcC
VRNTRTVKKYNQTTTEAHYYLSSVLPEHYRPTQWLDLIRGHWAGVEIRNHWRRDALMGEDRSRSRKPNLLANLAILRNALLALLPDHFPDQSLPEIREHLSSRPDQSLSILCS